MGTTQFVPQHVPDDGYGIPSRGETLLQLVLKNLSERHFRKAHVACGVHRHFLT